MATVKLHAPAGSTGCSFEGVAFEVKDGMVEVPEEAVETLASHGFATSKDGVKAPMALTEEAFADLSIKLTAAKQQAAELQGSLEAMRSERDAALAKAAELEKQVQAAKRK